MRLHEIHSRYIHYIKRLHENHSLCINGIKRLLENHSFCKHVMRLHEIHSLCIHDINRLHENHSLCINGIKRLNENHSFCKHGMLNEIHFLLHTWKRSYKRTIPCASYMVVREHVFHATDCLSLYENHSYCSATATISYPASLSKLPNGCQGHPRFYPSPPDRPPITKPDSNCVLRTATFIQLLAWVDIKMHKAVEA